MKIDLRPGDVWHQEALEFGKAHNSFVELHPSKNPVSWQKWRDYFLWLNWVPKWFLEVETRNATAVANGAIGNETWTAPIANPDEFTVKFKPVSTGPMPEIAKLRKIIGRAEPANYVFSEEERMAHIDRLRAAGCLTFGSADADKREIPWFQKLSRFEALANLARYRRDAGEDDVVE